MLPVQTPLAIAIFFTMWWIVLLAVLPIGIRSQHEDAQEAEDAPPPGSDPGAPKAPMLKKKALITTAVTTTLWTILMIVMKVMG